MEPTENPFDEDDAKSATTNDVAVKSKSKKQIENEPVMILYNNIYAGQSIKGILGMEDCEALISSKDELLEFFEEGNTDNTSKSIDEAFNVMVSACRAMQSTGVFKMEGSVMLLNIIRDLENKIDERRSVEDKLDQVKKRLNDKTNKNGGNRGGKSKGRGRGQ